MKTFKLYVPKYMNNGDPLPDNYLNMTVSKLTEYYGGATVYDATGYYQSDSGVLQSEPVIIVEIVGDDATLLRLIASSIKTDLQQESVLLTISDVESELT